MKTPLPEKYLGKMLNEHTKQFIDYEDKINQLITYLAELTEVVEGKSAYAEGYKQGKFDAEMDGAHLEFKKVTLTTVPTLKDTLLGEIRGIFYRSDYLIERTKYEDVEAIINRLIP
jgi:hypothetical protein